MVLVNYIYDMIVDTPSHMFYGRPLCFVGCLIDLRKGKTSLGLILDSAL